MKHACQLCLIIAALAAAPAALAGAQIVKCVDPAGHVTLTDQPCTDGAATVRMETDADYPQAAPPRPAVEHFPASRALPRQGAWSRPAPKRMALARDVATLKEARVQLLLLDGTTRGPHPRLAGLN